ncbi:MAG TPA: hypothetical protein QGF41_10740, partial [Gammaproteobacteria bacterium]|nr:hypothetical protein [Gammaproteobacteria bacterium]
RSDDAGRSAGFCFISTPHVRMNKNSPLNQCYICSIGADGVQSELLAHFLAHSDFSILTN